MNETSNSNGESTFQLFLFGVVLSLSVGAVEMATLALSSSTLPSPFKLLPDVSLTVGMALLVYVTLACLLYPLGRVYSLPVRALAPSFATFVGVLIVLMIATGHDRAPRSSADVLYLLVLALVSLFAAGNCYLAAKHSRTRQTPSMLVLALPVVAFGLYLLVALLLTGDPHRLSLHSVFGILSFVLVAVFFLWGVSRFSRRVGAVISLAALFGLVIVGGASNIRSTRSSTVADYTAEMEHEIEHVILITIDTLRASALSCYGPDGTDTPHIDELAEDGVVFQTAVSPAPWTLPALSSIMTGLSPSVHKTTRIQSKLPENLATLGEHMYRSGYYTAAIGNNVYLQHGLSRGFLEYDFYPKQPGGRSFGSRVFQKALLGESTVTSADLTRLAVDWLGTHASKDFFFWLHYLDPHDPYAPPPEYVSNAAPPPGIGTSYALRYNEPTVDLSSAQRDWIKKLYESEVRYVDDQVGEVMAELKRLGLYDDALIILTSDHGEEFWEHGGTLHAHSLYSEVLNVPLIVKLPQSSTKTRIETPVSTQRIMATVLDSCDVEHQLHDSYAGSLMPFWKPGDVPAIADPIISTAVVYAGEDQISVVDRDLKYVGSLASNREQLFDLRKDPAEQYPIELEGVAEENMKRILKSHFSMSEQLKTQFELDEEGSEMEHINREALEALGYL